MPGLGRFLRTTCGRLRRSSLLEGAGDEIYWGWKCRGCWEIGRVTTPSLRAECRGCGRTNMLYDIHIFRVPVRSTNRSSVIYKNVRKLQIGVLKAHPGVFGAAATSISRSYYQDWQRLASFVFRPHIEPSPKWFVQVFFDGVGRYIGEMSNDFILCGWVEEMKKELGESKQFQLRMPPELHWWLKTYAAKNQTTMTEVLLQHVRSLQAREQAAVHVDTL